MSKYNRYYNLQRESFRCVKCGKYREAKRVPTNHVCQYCRAKERKPQNVLITIDNNLVVTKNIHKRLIKVAHAAVPENKTLIIAEKVEAATPVIFIVLVIFIIIFGRDIIPKDSNNNWSLLSWTYVTFICVGIPVLIYLTAESFAKKPRVQQNRQIHEKIYELAKTRKNGIEEKGRFFVCSEWILLVNQVISEKGQYCVKCKKYINSSEDIVARHIKPRSTHPQLELSKDNIQILCRKCYLRENE